MKTFTILGLLLVLVIVTPTFILAQSPLPKEGSGANTSYFTGTLKSLPMGQDLVAITYEVFGVTTNDAGQGFFHNVSSRCVGGLSVVKGEWDNEQGMCVFVDGDGDQVFVRYSAGSGRLGAVAKGKSTLAGGTGKYTGLTGTYEWTRTALRPTMPGTTHAVMKATFTYKLP